MTKTIRYLLSFFVIFFIFLMLLICYVKIHIITNCVFTSDGNTTSITVNKHIHQLIDDEGIKECHIEVNQTKYKAWLSFKDEENSSYAYWLSVDTSFAFNNQTTLVNVDFGTLTVIKGIYYLW